MKPHAFNGLLICVLTIAWPISAAGQTDEALDGSVAEQEQGASGQAASALKKATGPLTTVNGEQVDEYVLKEAAVNDKEGMSGTVGTQGDFYLTNANYPANAVLDACAEGYHMASLWEILDVTNLVYAADHPDAYTKSDSGSGPPARWYGWIRTGWDASGSDTVGSGNCQNWSSVDNGSDGSLVRLSNDWLSQPSRLGAWEPSAFTCNSFGPVWCVAD
jgi:hypothetical protein